MGHSPMLGQPMHNRWNAEAADGPINADAGVVAKLMGDGRLNPDQWSGKPKGYSSRGSGVPLETARRRQCDPIGRAGSKVPTRIDVVEMCRSTQKQRHARSGCLHGSAGSGRVAGPSRHHNGTRWAKIHLPLCNEDQVLTATASDEPEGRAAVARRWRRGDLDLLCDYGDGSRTNRIRHLNRGVAPGGGRPLPSGTRCGSGSG